MWKFLLLFLLFSFPALAECNVPEIKIYKHISVVNFEEKTFILSYESSKRGNTIKGGAHEGTMYHTVSYTLTDSCISEIQIIIYYTSKIYINPKYKSNIQCFNEIIVHELKHREDYKVIINKQYPILSQNIYKKIYALQEKTEKVINKELTLLLEKHIEVINLETKRYSEIYHDSKESDMPSCK